MPISAIDTVSLAVEHTKQQLFKPFRFSQWTKLAVVGLLAGELGSGNGCNFHLPAHPGASSHGSIPGLPGVDLALLAGLISVLVIAGLLLGIILMYIGSVMRFVLFDSILAKECNITGGWNSRQGAGWRYFLWKLLYLLFTLGGLAVLIGIPAAVAFGAGWITEPREHLLPLILCGTLLFFAVVIFVIALASVFVLTKDFVIPQMALENISAFEGWRRLWPMITADKSGYAGYLGLKIVMAIGAGIVVGIATVILGLIIAIPTIGLSIVAVITGKSAGLTWNASTITVAIVVGCTLLAFFLYLVALISVPVIVFFPAYSIYFFASRYPALNAALYSASGTAQIPGAVSRYDPPPLPPSAEPIG